MRRKVACVSVGVFVLRGLMACGSSTSTIAPVDAGDDATTDASQPEAGTDVAADGDAEPVCALPGVFGSKACTRCLKGSCCDEITACEQDLACASLVRCVLACLPNPDAGGCRRGCIQQYPPGEAKYVAIEDCWFGDQPPGCANDCL